MNAQRELNRLSNQGYNKEDFIKNPHYKLLTRWTPFSCVLFSCIGLLLESHLYFIILGFLTLIGAFSNQSFYDLLFKYSAGIFFKDHQIPRHSLHRRIGCTLGAIIFLNAGINLFIGYYNLAVIPVIFLSTMAFFAGIYNWCFVSVLFNLFRKQTNKTNVCCN